MPGDKPKTNFGTNFKSKSNFMKMEPEDSDDV